MSPIHAGVLVGLLALLLLASPAAIAAFAARRRP